MSASENNHRAEDAGAGTALTVRPDASGVAAGIPIARAFSLFLFITLGFFGICIGLLATVVGQWEFARIQEHERQRQAMAVGSMIRSYLRERCRILQDHSSFPIITQAVMQPEQHRAKTSDFMATLSLLGWQGQLVLLDFEGKMLHATEPRPSFDYTKEPWLATMLSGDLPQFIGTSRSGQSYYWRIAAPVLYNGAAEGVLVAEMPVDELESLPDMSPLLSQARVEVFDGAERVMALGVEMDAAPPLRVSLPGSSISLLYRVDSTELEEAGNALLLRIAVMVAVLTVLAIGAAVTLGRRTFVLPLERFRSLVAALAEENEGPAAHPPYRLQEVQLLADDFNAMADRVIDRERALRKAHDELERRVRERTRELRNALDTTNTLLETIPACVVAVDANRRIQRVNKAALELLGYEAPEDVLDQRSHCTHCGGKTGECPVWDMGQKSDCGERTICTRDGQVVPVLKSAALVTLGGEDLLLEVFVDITDRKEAEARLKESEERFALVLKGTAAGLWDWNVQSGETVFNERWAEIAGYTLDELGTSNIQTWIDLCAPEDLQHSNELLRKHFAGELEQYNCECRMRHKDGRWVWVHDRGRVVEWTDDGKPLRMTGTHIDITARKHAEIELRNEARRRESILQSIGDGVIVLDPQRHVVLANHAAEELLGTAGPIAADRPFEQIVESHGPSRDTVCQALGAKLVRGLWDVAHPTSRSLRVTASPFEDGSGKPAGHVLVLHDVTREREMDRMKTDFVSSVSHELRTPLTSIKGFTATILRAPDMPEETRTEFLQIVDEQTDRLTSLIEDLLEISRIESGLLRLELQPRHVEELVAAVVAELSPAAAAENVRLESDLPGDLPAVAMDLERMRSVFLNLVMNAIKFTPAGEGVTVMAEASRNFVTVKVSDTGLGIPEKALPRIFERFYRVHRPGTEIPGTGLGLAICKELVELHGGRIEAESALGEGSVFSVYLPLEPTPESRKLEDSA